MDWRPNSRCGAWIGDLALQSYGLGLGLETWLSNLGVWGLDWRPSSLILGLDWGLRGSAALHDHDGSLHTICWFVFLIFFVFALHYVYFLFCVCAYVPHINCLYVNMFSNINCILSRLNYYINNILQFKLVYIYKMCHTFT